jgi:hypothetical protein
MKQRIFIILFLFSFLQCNGQADSTVVRLVNHLYAEGGMIGTLIYPGAFIGTGLQISNRNKQKRDGSDLLITGYAAADINWYHHPQFNDNIYLTLEWRNRRTRSGGLFWEYSAGPGLSRTFTGGTVYNVSDQGAVKVEKIAGYTYALLTAGEKLGYDMSSHGKVPISFSLKMSIIMMFPYNSTIYFRPVLQAGISYCPQFLNQESANKK